MANQEQLSMLKQGVEAWNKWRKENRSAIIDLRQADLREASFRGVNLSFANLETANLIGVDFSFGDLREANLSKAKLVRANFTRANLTRADLRGAILTRANLKNARFIKANMVDCSLYVANLDGTNLSGANLEKADFSGAYLVQTIIDKARISGSSVYAANVWDLKGKFKEQKDLVITPPGSPAITVDNIKVAQFIYLILNNQEIREVINTVTSKSVLILGRFADEKRKAILNALRNKLREYNLLPIVFDFARPTNRNITETVKTLAGISYFVIADVTSPKSSPLELQAIVPDYQIPVIPIIQDAELPFSMIDDLKNQHYGLLDPLTYDSEEKLIKALKPAIIDRAIKKHNELKRMKAKKPRIRSVNDFLNKEME